jgi:hypothetical protein
MNKKLFKNAVCFLVLLVMVAPAVIATNANVASAQQGVGIDDDYFQGGVENLNLSGQDSEVGVVGTVTNIVNVVLGLLGLIAVIIILIGGFKWMTAQGAEDKVEKAKDTIKYGLIGLAIILLAYLIVRIVIGSVVGFADKPSDWSPT